jgi:hypothetical protein
MDTTIKIPIEFLRGHQFHPGDVLQVIAAETESVTVALKKEAKDTESRNAALETWLQTSKGLISLSPGETLEDLRDAHYQVERTDI